MLALGVFHIIWLSTLSTTVPVLTVSAPASLCTSTTPQTSLSLSPADITYFLDTVTTLDLFRQAESLSNHIIIIDHHWNTDQLLQTWSPNAEIIHNSHNSACILTWNYFKSKKTPLSDSIQTDNSIENLLNYIQDRDLYRNSLPNCSEIISGFIQICKGQEIPGLFLDFSVFNVEYLRIEGVIPSRKRAREIERELRKKVVILGVNGRKEWKCYGIVTKKAGLRSELAGELARRSEKDLGWAVGVVGVEEEGGMRVSLRTVGERVNVAEVCREAGGGGHATAAGATIPKRIFWRKWVLRRDLYLPTASPN